MFVWEADESNIYFTENVPTLIQQIAYLAPSRPRGFNAPHKIGTSPCHPNPFGRKNGSPAQKAKGFAVAKALTDPKVKDANARAAGIGAAVACDPVGAKALLTTLSKDKEKWGELKGTRTQLLYDISKILDEAVVNIDDAAIHNPDSPLLRKSLYMLSEAVGRILPQLDRLRAAAQEQSEADQLDRAIETAKEIADAAKERGINAEDMKTKDSKDSKATKKGN